STSTLSSTTSLRALRPAVVGSDASSSTISSTLRPASVGCSAIAARMPFSYGMPSAETGPDSELMNPILRSAASACESGASENAKAVAAAASKRVEVCIIEWSKKSTKNQSLHALRGTPRNRLCRAAGVAPCKGVGAATRSARSLGVCNKPSGPLVLPPARGLAQRYEVREAWGVQQACTPPGGGPCSCKPAFSSLVALHIAEALAVRAADAEVELLHVLVLAQARGLAVP